MRQSTRLILNTGATYVRMLVTVVLSVIATRWLVLSLGNEGFGVYTAVASIVMMLLVISDSLQSSSDRFLAYARGLGDADRLSRLASTLVGLFGAVGAAIALAGFLLGFIADRLVNAPPGVDADLRLVFWYATLTFALFVLHTPFKSLLTSHQSILVVTAIELLDAVLRLAVAGALFFAGVRRVETFALLLCGTQALVTIASAAGALLALPAVRLRLRLLDRHSLREVCGYTGWAMLGNGAMRVRAQGSQVVINHLAGPVANTAYSVAQQLAGYQSNIGAAVYRAAQPVLIASHAAGAVESSHRLVLVMGRYVTLMMLFLMVPLLLDTPLILRLWIPTFPLEHVWLVRLGLVGSAILWLSMGYQVALQSTGDIRGYMVFALCGDLCALGVAAFGLSVVGLGAWVVPAAITAWIIVLTTYSLLVIGRKIGLAPARWVEGTVAPVLLVFAGGTAAALVPRLLMEPSVWRVAAIFGVHGACAPPLIWWLGLPAWERAVFRGFFRRGAALAHGKAKGLAAAASGVGKEAR